MANVPDELLYSKDHEWAKVTGRRVRVGITAHAVDQLGDVTLVGYEKAAKVGASLAAGAVFGQVESVKTVSDLYAPVSGVVVALNDAAVDAPESLNAGPYDAWLIELELAEGASVEGLMNASAYSAYLGSL